MVKQMNTQPLQKQFGEMITIQKPDLSSSSDSDGDDDSLLDMRFHLRPELPSHVPTPETINHGLFRTMFATDDDDEGAKQRSNRRKADRQQPITDAPTPATLHASSLTPRNLDILIASPSGSKWGSDVWNYKRRVFMTECCSCPSLVAEQSSSPSHSVGNSIGSKNKSISLTYNSTTCAQNKTRAKLILSEETVERTTPTKMVARPKSSHNVVNNKPPSASLLQRQWMQENALNLHSSCQQESRGEDLSSRRSPFMFARRRERVV
jgi:hypothetical protein